MDGGDCRTAPAKPGLLIILGLNIWTSFKLHSECLESGFPNKIWQTNIVGSHLRCTKHDWSCLKFTGFDLDITKFVTKIKKV